MSDPRAVLDGYKEGWMVSDHDGARAFEALHAVLDECDGWWTSCDWDGPEQEIVGSIRRAITAALTPQDKEN